MNSCEFVTFVSIIACNIAKDRTQSEINLLSTFFSQLGDTLATISAFEENVHIGDVKDVQNKLL